MLPFRWLPGIWIRSFWKTFASLRSTSLRIQMAGKVVQSLTCAGFSIGRMVAYWPVIVKSWKFPPLLETKKTASKNTLLTPYKSVQYFHFFPNGGDIDQRIRLCQNDSNYSQVPHFHGLFCPHRQVVAKKSLQKSTAPVSNYTSEVIKSQGCYPCDQLQTTL